MVSFGSGALRALINPLLFEGVNHLFGHVGFVMFGQDFGGFK